MSWFFTSGGQSIGVLVSSISPSSDYSGLISFRIDWFVLLTVQGTIKSLLQHHSSKTSVLRRSAYFIVQLSHPYMTTGKTTALTIWIFVGKVMSLLFNMLSRFAIAFLPRSKGLLVSWLQLPSKVILEPKKINAVKLWARLCRITKDRSWWRAWQNEVHWRREWQTTSAFLLWESLEQLKKVAFLEVKNSNEKVAGGGGRQRRGDDFWLYLFPIPAPSLSSRTEKRLGIIPSQ